MKIRIKFAKRGNMKFIGHLDIMRYFQKAMRRADISIAYSEGFSPHQKMSFASPLGVGLLSEGEYMDIEIHHSKASAEMVEDLNRVMVEGITVLSFRKLMEHAGNAMSSVAAADYRLTFRQGCEPADAAVFYKELSAFFKKDTIPVIKKTKKGEREIDLKPFLYEASADEKGIFLKLSAGSSDNIKPELVMKAFYESQGMEMPEFAFQITRLEVYANQGTEEEKKWVPLEDLGEEIE